MIKTVIIDDDYVSREILRDMLEKFLDTIEIIGEAGSVAEGVRLIENSDPELVLLDISMPDGTGFELLDKLKKINFKLIFITAYSEYAVKAFKYSAFDYIVKPLIVEELIMAIQRIPNIQRVEDNMRVNALKENLLVSDDGASKTVALPEINGFAIVNIEDIVRCEGKRNYTRIIFKEAPEKVVSRTLLEFEHLLSPLGFLRIHRSHLVNILNVVRYLKSDGGMVELKTGELLKVSPKHKETLLNRLLFNKL
ncbi:MAG: LytTR family DNA-binding domain-containing protein [Bacteroidota bacterium]